VRRREVRALNLRVAPTTLGDAPLLTLPHGTIVEVMGGATPGWIRVRTRFNGEALSGYVGRRNLEPTRAALAALDAPQGGVGRRAAAGGA
jgi:hypothetical protein